MLQTKQLQWSQDFEDNRKWVGSLPGSVGVTVSLFQSPDDPESWWIVPNFQKALIAPEPGLDAAKRKSQELFTEFALGLFVPIALPTCSVFSAGENEITNNPFLVRPRNQYNSELEAWAAISEKTGYAITQVISLHSTYHWRWQIQTDSYGILQLPLNNPQ